MLHLDNSVDVASYEVFLFSFVFVKQKSVTEIGLQYLQQMKYTFCNAFSTKLVLAL